MLPMTSIIDGCTATHDLLLGKIIYSGKYFILSPKMENLFVASSEKQYLVF